MGRIVLIFLGNEGSVNVTAVKTKQHSGRMGSFAKRSDLVNQSVKEACEQLISSSTLTRNTEPALMQHQRQHQRPANSTEVDTGARPKTGTSTDPSQQASTHVVRGQPHLLPRGPPPMRWGTPVRQPRAPAPWVRPAYNNNRPAWPRLIKHRLPMSRSFTPVASQQPRRSPPSSQQTKSPPLVHLSSSQSRSPPPAVPNTQTKPTHPPC